MGLLHRLSGLAVGAALAAAYWPMPASARSAAVVARTLVAGDSLIVLDSERQLWVRHLPIGTRSRWTKLEMPVGLAGVQDLACAPDGSGSCALLLAGESGTEIVLLAPGAATLTRTGVAASRLFGFTDRTTLYFGRPVDSGQTEVRAYELDRSSVRTISTVGSNEMVQVATIDGRLRLTARRLRGLGRILDQSPMTALPYTFPLNSLNLSSGVIAVQSWSSAWASDPQEQRLSLFDFRTDGRGGFSGTTMTLTTFPIASPLIDEVSLVTDASGDVYGVATGADGRWIVALCRLSDRQFGLRPLFQIPGALRARIVATMAGTGALIIESLPGHAPRIGLLQLSEPSVGGYDSRRCSQTEARFEDIGFGPTGAFEGWTSIPGSIVAADGARLSFVLLRPRDPPVERLIVDVYGAYGSIVDNYPILPSDLDHLLRQRAAVAFVTVRGDGNAGIVAAMASRTPNRQVAIDDLIAVTEHVSRQLPGLDVPATARGKSAGAWLAMAAAFERPDLFAGAIGIAGGYLFSELPEMQGPNAFFGPHDSFDRNDRLARAACASQRFRLIHAMDDPVVSFDQARRFATMLDARGCLAEFVALDQGGHGIGATTGTEDVSTLGSWTAFGPGPNSAPRGAGRGSAAP